MRTVLIVAVVCLLTAGSAHGRLFHAFDFEERRLGNDEDVPMNWAKVDAVDFPHYVVGRLTTDRARSGRYSFRMDLDGGSCAYQYDEQRLPVVVGGHYRLSGYCQTSVPLSHARARLTLAVVDADGAVLTAAASDPYASTAADGDGWHELSVEVTADDPRSAFLRVRMELVQPNRYQLHPDPLSIPANDLHGTAWFDDLAVAQVPRASLSTSRPGNVFRRGEQPALSVLLADPSSDDLTAQLVVTDVDGRPVYQRTGTVTPPADGRLSMPLPITAAGWYRATLRLAAPGEGGDCAAVATTGYVQLADDGPSTLPDCRFGTACESLPAAAWPATADVLPLLSAGRAKIAMDGPSVDAAVRRLMAADIAPIGWLPADVTDAAAADVIARQAGHIRQWQIGRDDTDAFVDTDSAARRRVARVVAIGTDLAGRFELSVPYPVGSEPPRIAGVSSLAWVPTSILPGEIGPALRDRTSSTVSIEPLDGGRCGPAVRAADLVERVASALAVGASRVDVPVPLTTSTASLPDPQRSPVEPTDLFPVERTLLTQLAGTACRGPVPVAQGIEAVLFERPDRDGLAVIWSDDEERLVPFRLGTHLTRMDLWGNAVDVPADRLVAGPVPYIIDGVDVPASQFRAGLTIDRPMLESILLHQQVRRLHVTNPYRVPITGTVRLRGPAGWTLTPAVVPLQLSPGESVDPDIGIDLPVNVRLGGNTVVAEVDLQPGRLPSTHLSIPLPFSVGLSEVGVKSTAVRDGSAIVVQQQITNYGDRPVDYVAYADVPGQPRVEHLVPALGAGRSTLRRYRFVVGDSTGPVTVHVGARESDGPRVLNDVLMVP